MCSHNKKTENIVEYRKTYYEKHKEQFKKNEICNICGTSFQLWNKSAHIKSKKHKYAVINTENNNLTNELTILKKQQEIEKIKQEILILTGKIIK